MACAFRMPKKAPDIKPFINEKLPLSQKLRSSYRELFLTQCFILSTSLVYFARHQVYFVR